SASVRRQRARRTGRQTLSRLHDMHVLRAVLHQTSPRRSEPEISLAIFDDGENFVRLAKFYLYHGLKYVVVLTDLAAPALADPESARIIRAEPRTVVIQHSVCLRVLPHRSLVQFEQTVLQRADPQMTVAVFAKCSDATLTIGGRFDNFDFDELDAVEANQPRA